MTYEDWKFAQIGIGVSRCPTDIDQDKTLLDEAAAERRKHLSVDRSLCERVLGPRDESDLLLNAELF